MKFNFIKLIIFLFCISLAYDISAQIAFVRVYNSAGEKINKGDIIAITDTSLQLKKGDNMVTIPVSDIGSIKTKHSAGNNVLIGSLIGTSVCVAIGVISADPNNDWVGWTAGEGAIGGVIYGAPLGAAIGGITVLFKNSKTYVINGDITKWKAFQLSATARH